MRLACLAAGMLLFAVPALAEEPQPPLAPLTPPPKPPWLRSSRDKASKDDATSDAIAKRAPKKKAIRKVPGKPGTKGSSRERSMRAQRPAAEPELGVPALVPLAPPVPGTAAAARSAPANAPPASELGLPPSGAPAAGAAPLASRASAPASDLPPPPVLVSPSARPAPPGVRSPAPEAALESPAPRSRPGWSRPAAIATGAAGVVAAAVGIVYGVQSRSDLNQAETAFRGNGGAYRQADLAALQSGNSAAHRANVLFVAGGVLAAASALLAFAF